MPLHASLVARFAAGVGWRGALLHGPSGVGKSELALRLIAQGWRLVADDRVVVWSSGNRLWGRAPEVLQGLLEVRGVGVLPHPALLFSEINWVFDCVSGTELIERVPEPATTILNGATLPVYRLNASSCTAAEKVAAICGGLSP